jgi:hypothetical protein
MEQRAVNELTDLLVKGGSAMASSHDAMNSNGVIGGQSGNNKFVVTDYITTLLFYVLIMASTALVFLRPQIRSPDDFYNHCFSKLRGLCRWLSPPRPAFYFWIEAIMNVLQVVAIVNFLWNLMIPAPGSDSDYYVTIFSFFMVLMIFKYLYTVCFFNYHHHCIPLGFCIVWALGGAISSVVLMGLFGTRASQSGVTIIWMSFAFQLFISLWYIALFGWTCYVFYCFCFCKVPCVCHKKHEAAEVKSKNQQSMVNNNGYDTQIRNAHSSIL